MSQVKPLVLQAKAFVKMIKYLAEYANYTTMMTPNWVEAMGIMFCKDTPTKYVIVDAEGITYGDLVSVETSPQQVAQIVNLGDKKAKEDPGIFAGGWFHSHPGHSLFYSGTDIANQVYWQSGNPNGVGLVFDLTQVSEVFLGFKFFRLDSRESQNYHEVSYELHGFTEETLIEAFKPIGIDIKTIHRLAKHMGFKAAEGILEFDKIEVPQTDDPVGTAKLAIELARKAYLQGNVNKSLEQYRIANLLLKDVENVEFFELFITTTLKLAKLCVLNDFPETAQALLKDVILRSKKMVLKPEKYVGRAEVIFGYLGDFNHKPEDGLYHYKKAISLFESKKLYWELYKANELAAGASWKFKIQDDALKYLKDALYNIIMAEKANKDKRTPIIWGLLKKGLNAKIKSAEGFSIPSGIEQV